jgi:hypothetical protein
LINGVSTNLPVSIRADLQIALYRLLKDIENKVRELDLKFTTILQDKITENIRILQEQDRVRKEKENQEGTKGETK